ncbi:MAG: hypothetical protein JXA23_11370 [Bacteroidales bacterium]|nr:hypothetical protein [Bacteroidales bacterium]
MTIPVVETGEAKEITWSSVILGGRVIDDGGDQEVSRGICYSLTPYVDVGDSLMEVGHGAGNFEGTLDGLTHSTHYYYKAFATNEAGTGYGELYAFSTEAGGIPTAITEEVQCTSPYMATCNAEIVNLAGSTTITYGICWGTSSHPDTSGLHTEQTHVLGPGIVSISYTENLFELNPGTDYYTRAYVTHSAGTGYGKPYGFTTPVEQIDLPCPGQPLVIDSRDGQTYPTVQIGTQCWLQRNLNYNAATSRCYEDNLTNCTEFGRLYDWQTALGVCPDGWHLPSWDEWDLLLDYLGYYLYAGGRLKEAGTVHWEAPNSGATNSSGFTGLPGGSYSAYSDTYTGLGKEGCFWSREFYNPWFVSLLMEYDTVAANSWFGEKENGLSVRCLRD